VVAEVAWAKATEHGFFAAVEGQVVEVAPLSAKGSIVLVIDESRASPPRAVRVYEPPAVESEIAGKISQEDQTEQGQKMLNMDDVNEELQRGFGLSVNELEPILRVGGDAAEMKFMECCRYLWQADGAELTEPFIEAAFYKLPEKSRCVLFQRMLTIVYVAQDAELSPP
jgi:hypothetical protein